MLASASGVDGGSWTGTNRSSEIGATSLEGPRGGAGTAGETSGMTTRGRERPARRLASDQTNNALWRSALSQPVCAPCAATSPCDDHHPAKSPSHSTPADRKYRLTRGVARARQWGMVGGAAGSPPPVPEPACTGGIAMPGNGEGARPEPLATRSAPCNRPSPLQPAGRPAHPCPSGTG